MSNLSQFIGSGNIPVGSEVIMHSLANAGTPSFTTSSNELFVNNATATITPQSSCNSLLTTALNASNDVNISNVQVNYSNFMYAANIPASGYVDGLITSSSVQSTHGFYVGSTYYFFSPNDTFNPMTWISTTDLTNFTPSVVLTPLLGLMIVGVYYNTTNSTWYFLESNGTIWSTTNLTTFASSTWYSLPALGVANAYVKLTLINSIWYAIGGSTTGGGYRVSTSTNLINWTTVIENTAGAGPATTICQGFGSGASTEILIGCSGTDTTLKSVNNGTSFTANTATTGLSGAHIKKVFYSSRTGLYYIGSVQGSGGSYVIDMTVSSTTTLTTATWSNFSTGLTSQATGYTSYPMEIVDTGTWVGIVFSTGAVASLITYFIYGASYNTLSSSLNTFIGFTDSVGNTSYTQGTRAVWLNNTLVMTYNHLPTDSNLSYQRKNCVLITSIGATCSTNITLKLAFPNAFASTALVTQSLITPYTPTQMQQWSGLAYLSGSYYAGAGLPFCDSSGNYYNYSMFMFKLNSSLTTFSCPVSPVVASSGYTLSTNTTQTCLSAPQINSSGNGFNWVGYAKLITNVQAFLPAFSFNGSTLTAVSLNPSATIKNQGYACGNTTITTQPASSQNIPKWSSVLGAYVFAYPALNQTNSGSSSAEVVTCTTLSTSPVTPLITVTNSTLQNSIYFVDVLSTGIVVAATAVSTSYFTLFVNYGLGNIQLFQTPISNINVTGIWEINISGTSYLVFMYCSTLGVNNMLIWKLSLTDIPIQVLSYVDQTLNLTPINTYNLRRVYTVNGNYYLGDVSGNTTSNRNSLMLSFSNGTFTVTPAYCYANGDFSPANSAGVYTGLTTITTSGSPVPSVFLPPVSATGTFTKVR